MIDKMRAGKWKKYLGSEPPVTNQWKRVWINFQCTLSKFKNNNVWMALSCHRWCEREHSSVMDTVRKNQN